jgi:hypothetical protein
MCSLEYYWLCKVHLPRAQGRPICVELNSTPMLARMYCVCLTRVCQRRVLPFKFLTVSRQYSVGLLCSQTFYRVNYGYLNRFITNR